MTLQQSALCIACVVAISCGQLLFKSTGLALSQHGTWFNTRVLFLLGVAGAIYASATLLWIHLLQTLPLSNAYYFMALSFVFVPIGSSVFFHEQLTSMHILGSALVICGIVLLARAN